MGRGTVKVATLPAPVGATTVTVLLGAPETRPEAALTALEYELNKVVLTAVALNGGRTTEVTWPPSVTGTVVPNNIDVVDDPPDMAMTVGVGTVPVKGGRLMTVVCPPSVMV